MPGWARSGPAARRAFTTLRGACRGGGPAGVAKYICAIVIDPRRRCPVGRIRAAQAFGGRERRLWSGKTPSNDIWTADFNVHILSTSRIQHVDRKES